MRNILLASTILLGFAGAVQAQELVVAQSSDLRSNVPGVNRDGNTDGIMLHIVEGLVGYAENGEVKPLLAESFETSEDGLVYTFKLRDGIKFSDGKPITTADVAFSLAAMYDPRSQAAAWKDSMSINNKPIETRIIDERNMQLVFPEPVAAVENYIDNLGVLPKHILNADFEAGKLADAYKITTPPEKRPAVPRPATARPTTKAGLEGARAHTRLPTSKTATAAR